MRFLESFGKFWYDVIIRDDWKIAFAVVTATSFLCAMMARHVLADGALAVLAGVLIVMLFAVSLAIDVRSDEK